ncbi:MAG: hypothetical protein J6A29_05180 [Clostridia bacterium]|nr:hypothetical protein [Clostridia bacterium]
MMRSYPLWVFPNFRRNYYPNYAYCRPKYYARNSYNKPNNNNLNKSTTNDFSDDTCNNSDNYINDTKKLDFSCDNNYYSDNECFNILGLSLHIDDLLILALLFFLYKEGTDDIYLYIVLFLLLLS